MRPACKAATSCRLLRSSCHRIPIHAILTVPPNPWHPLSNPPQPLFHARDSALTIPFCSVHPWLAALRPISPVVVLTCASLWAQAASVACSPPPCYSVAPCSPPPRPAAPAVPPLLRQQAAWLQRRTREPRCRRRAGLPAAAAASSQLPAAVDTGRAPAPAQPLPGCPCGRAGGARPAAGAAR